MANKQCVEHVFYVHVELFDMTTVTIVTKISHINMTNYDCDVIFLMMWQY